MSRIAPGTRREIGALAWAGSRVAGRITHTAPPAFITVLGRSRRQFWGWLAFAGSLMPFGHLPRRETEAVILRVSTLTRCAYENAHHRSIARKVGLTDAQIEDACALERTGAAFDERANVVLDTVDALVTRRDLDDDEWQRLRAHLDERECIELLQLTGSYVSLSVTLGVLRIEPDTPRSAE